MRRVVGLGVVAVVLAAAPGCGRSPDGLMQTWIADINRLAEAIEEGVGEDRQKELSDKARDTESRIEKLKLNPEQKAELAERHKAEFEKALLRLAAATKTPNFQLELPNAPR
jgi:phage FluMu gp28-like protein